LEMAVGPTDVAGWIQGIVTALAGAAGTLIVGWFAFGDRRRKHEAAQAEHKRALEAADAAHKKKLELDEAEHKKKLEALTAAERQNPKGSPVVEVKEPAALNHRVIVTWTRGTFFSRRSRFEVWLYVSAFDKATLDIKKVNFKVENNDGYDLGFPQTLELSPDQAAGAQLIIKWDMTDGQVRALLKWFQVHKECTVFHYAEMTVTLIGRLSFKDKVFDQFQLAVPVFFMLENRFD
jgi:hypothetical protein